MLWVTHIPIQSIRTYNVLDSILSVLPGPDPFFPTTLGLSDVNGPVVSTATGQSSVYTRNSSMEPNDDMADTA